ncbi:helix-turn-helix transcriptional regulator [Bacillus albus]|uniref:helix-turn-helix domain-containing protein n=1 Tax=Bacillus cereus group TaxID=86661 RepID=UPI001419B9D3|nr:MULTISPECIES: helix-turn-helix transcriptional regulator [Bacillus cereus group]MDA2325736.1 helix-turn-helix transcriptional regulator [Bacillus cereus group sp. Bc177]
MSLGQQLKKFRELQNLSQEDVAKKIGVTRQAVYKWENDKSYPDIDNLVILSEFYNVTLDDLIKGNDSFKKKIKIDNENYASFYISFILIFLGICIKSSLIFGLGILLPIFYDSFKKMINSIIGEFKSIIKGN